MKPLGTTARALTQRWCAAVACAAMLAGCGVFGGAADEPGHDEWITVSDTTPSAEALVASPIVRRGREGLEMQWWVVDVDDDTLLAALASAGASRSGLAPDLESRLAANGLRSVLVPVDSLTGLRDSLRVIGATQRHWLGRPSTWTEAARGPAWRDQRALRLDTGPLVLDSGALRLMLRAWSVPIPAGDAAASRLRVEITPQHIEAVREAQRSVRLADDPGSATPASFGLVFDRMRAAWTLGGEAALVIYPRRPDSERERDAEAGAPDTVRSPELGEVARGDEGSVELPAEPRTRWPEDGPAPLEPVLPTIGEAALAAGLLSGDEPASRALVVLLPYVSQWYDVGFGPRVTPSAGLGGAP